MIETIDALAGLMRQDGAVRIYAKKLAPNDNSKNQVYLGGDFTALNIIPYGKIETDDTELAGSDRDRAKAPVRFWWVDENGHHEAPNAQLILYPKYPEVRMSGFLKGCRNAPADVMRVRDEGRVLLLGITVDGRVFGYAAAADSPLAREVYASDGLEEVGVFLELPTLPEAGSTKERLLAVLAAIYAKHWIPSQKLGADSIARPYAARNGGGYTLEAELGISPNGYSEPDYLGWEIKQYGVTDFDKFRPKSPVTLLTPEPTGGYYRDQGVEAFVRRFGYADKSGKTGRLNFGGVYSTIRQYHADTGLQLRMTGYDFGTGKIVDLDGGIALLNRNEEVAALWKYTGILEHWKRKHAQAAYVPSLFRQPPPEYWFGPKVLLCEESDLTLFLRAIANGTIYYDPAIKLENDGTPSMSIKRRSQFRIRHDQLGSMYHQTELVELQI
ncbi:MULTISPECIES: MvaI/BcnI family restriction endonuclease [Pseudomonadota]|uniref:MvaI/BcnI family restriction endonuclease n=1 Tax=Pseudomonadota TaxID=1224 RepID=UPI003267B585